MTSYAPDTSAVAVILSDHGSLAYVEDYYASFRYKRQVRIKIMKKAGYKYANIEIPFFGAVAKGEEVTDIKASTYNLLDGKIIEDKVKPNEIFTEKSDRRRHYKKFAMPNVKVGSVIEYSYTINSRYFQNLRGWDFQSVIPTVWSEYSVRIPATFEFKLVRQGNHPIYTPEQLGLPHNFRKEGNRWIAKDVPALKLESYVTTLSDYTTKIEFELQKIKYSANDVKIISGSWQEFVEMLSKEKDFGVPLTPANRFERPIGEIKAKFKTPAEQVAGIYDLVKTNMAWNGYSGWTVEKPLPELYYGGEGDAGDINITLIAMLREAGFKADPVLVSTRGYGKPYKASPLHSKFNYVIAQVTVDGNELLLDATEKELTPGMLPVRCLNGEGYLVDGENSKWITVEPEASFSEYFVGNLTIDTEGVIAGTGEELLDGYMAKDARQVIKEEGIEKYAANYNKGSGSLKTNNAIVSNLDSLHLPLSVNYKITSTNSSKINMLYLNPVMGRGATENPFKLPVRTYPVDFAAPIKETVVCNFKIPAGWKVEEVPQNINLVLPGRSATYSYMVQQTGDILMVVSKLNVNKTVFTPEEYPQLRELYNQVVAKHAEQVVLKKVVVN
nr:DUF3857 domain-containing protein [Pontibacter sp. Tf4]